MRRENESVVGSLVRSIRNRDYQRALVLAEQLGFSTAKSLRGFLEFMLFQAYLMGQSFLSGRAVRAQAVRRLQVPDEVTLQADIFLSGLERDLGSSMRQWARDLVELSRSQESQRIAYKIELSPEDRLLGEKINAIVMGGARAEVNLRANLVTSRLATFGFLRQAQEEGVARYEISEVLDEKTCPFCRGIHGTQFSVTETLAERMRTLLSLRDATALKEMAPFPPQTKDALREYDRWTPEQFRERGFDVPPFHPHCRGILVPVGTVAPTDRGGFGSVDPRLPGPIEVEGSLEDAALVRGVLDELPNRVWNPLVLGGWRVRASKRISYFDPGYRGLDHVIGRAKYVEGHIGLSTRVPVAGRKSTLRHEVGHAVDVSAVNDRVMRGLTDLDIVSMRRVSDSEGFVRAYKDDLRRLGPFERRQLSYYLPKHARPSHIPAEYQRNNGRREAFAEALAWVLDRREALEHWRDELAGFAAFDVHFRDTVAWVRQWVETGAV